MGNSANILIRNAVAWDANSASFAWAWAHGAKINSHRFVCFIIQSSTRPQTPLIEKHFEWKHSAVLFVCFFSYIFFSSLSCCAWCVCGIVVDLECTRHHMNSFFFRVFQKPYDRFLRHPHNCSWAFCEWKCFFCVEYAPCLVWDRNETIEKYINQLHECIDMYILHEFLFLLLRCFQLSFEYQELCCGARVDSPIQCGVNAAATNIYAKFFNEWKL